MVYTKDTKRGEIMKVVLPDKRFNSKEVIDKNQKV